MERSQYTLGIVIVIAGAAILLGKLGLFDLVIGVFWPIFVLLPGLLFHLLYFGRVLPAGVLVPGGILVTYSFLFLYCNIFGWSQMSFLWPVFILGVAVGLYEFHFFDREHSKGALTASMILAAIAAIFFVFTLLLSSAVYVVAVGLIAIGALLMIRRPRSW